MLMMVVVAVVVVIVEGSRSDAKNAPSFLPSFEYTTANIPLLSY